MQSLSPLFAYLPSYNYIIISTFSCIVLVLQSIENHDLPRFFATVSLLFLSLISFPHSFYWKKATNFETSLARKRLLHPHIASFSTRTLPDKTGINKRQAKEEKWFGCGKRLRNKLEIRLMFGNLGRISNGALRRYFYAKWPESKMRTIQVCRNICETNAKQMLYFPPQYPVFCFFLVTYV